MCQIVKETVPYNDLLISRAKIVWPGLMNREVSYTSPSLWSSFSQGRLNVVDARCRRSSDCVKVRLSIRCTTWMFQTNIQGQSREIKIHPRPDSKQRLNICFWDVSKFSLEVKKSLASPFLLPSPLTHPWQGDTNGITAIKCLLEAAIKFHFEIMHAKVSLNPSQR